MSPDPAPRDEVDLEAWLTETLEATGGRAALGDLDSGAIVTTVLDLVRDVAHGVARPAGPLAAFAVGVAIGAAGSATAAGEKADQVRSLVARRQQTSGT